MTNVNGSNLMPRDQRLRRCLILCCHFARHLAFYRARGEPTTRKPQGDFWISVDANFIDMAVLEWCKLFADPPAQHSWTKVVSDPIAFEPGLLEVVGMSADEWAKLIAHIRRYRDKFLAHLDSDLVMNIPELETAFTAAKFYYDWILRTEIDPIRCGDAPSSLKAFYDERLAHGLSTYSDVQGI